MNMLIIILLFLTCGISNGAEDNNPVIPTRVIPVKSDKHWLFNETLVTYKNDSTTLKFIDILTGLQTALHLGLPITHMNWDTKTSPNDLKKEYYLYTLSNLNNEQIKDVPCVVNIIDIGGKEISKSLILSHPEYKKIAPYGKLDEIYLARIDNQIDIIDEDTGEIKEQLPQSQSYELIDPYKQYGMYISCDNTFNLFGLHDQKEVSLNIGNSSLGRKVRKVIYGSDYIVTRQSNVIVNHKLDNDLIKFVGVIHNTAPFVTEMLSLDNQHLITFDKNNKLKVWQLPYPQEPTSIIPLNYPIERLFANEKAIAASTGKEIIILDKSNPVAPLSKTQKFLNDLEKLITQPITHNFNHKCIN